jgi:glucose/arabinose dehydrogenase
MKIITAVMFSYLIIIFGCSSGTDQVNAQVELEVAFPNLSFTRPVDLQYPNDNSNRLFMVEQQGIIYAFENNREANTKNVFLDIRDLVNDSGNEEGLLGLAFHSNYQNNGYFYVDYTAANPRRTVIARYQVSASNPDSAIKNSEFIILEVNQPYSNHNAGQIVFGPDGYLYITLGDGGSGGDPQGNGQNLKTLLGSILRIDVDQTRADLNYDIPDGNPFVGNLREFREEIYAYGLRNPWRISFDPETQWLWAADVGQNTYEEIDIIEKGKNYGWNIMEGFHCYSASSCDTTGLTMPIWEYSHSVGQSITGGFVYRGSKVSELIGKYIYADYVSRRIWALEYSGDGEPTNTLLIDTDLNITSFGVDRNKELYICAFDGRIYRFKETTTNVLKSKLVKFDNFQLAQNFPNPFNSSTVIKYNLESENHVVLEIYNTLGQLIKRLVNDDQSAGNQSVVWNGNDMNNQKVASGIYLYKLTIAGLEKTKKMLYLP